jgi:hypothetical protein
MFPGNHWNWAVKPHYFLDEEWQIFELRYANPTNVNKSIISSYYDKNRFLDFNLTLKMPYQCYTIYKACEKKIK